MKQLLVRTYRDPYALASPEDVLERDLFGGDNNGNLLFSEAAVRALSVKGTDVTCVALESQPLDPREANEKFDHLVLPLANAFRPSFKGRLESLTALVEQLTIPVTVLGVGAQSDIEFGFEQLAPVDDTVRRFAAAVLDRAPSLGVRGEFTQSYLAHLGFRDVEVIGCPSMFYNGADLPTRPLASPPDEHSRIGFNLTPKLPEAEALARDLASRYPGLTYFPQGKRELELVLWGRPGIPHRDPATAGFNDLAHPLFTGVTTHVHVHPRSWIEDLAGFDFNLGTRIHGNVAALLGGTPSHLLSADSRTRELATYFELPWTRLTDLEHPLDLARLTEGADYEAVGRGHAGRFARYRAYLESHGLDHVWADGARSSYDQKLRNKLLPAPAVSGPDTSIELTTRLGWVRRRNEQGLAALEARLDQQEKQLNRLRRQFREQQAGGAGRAQRISRLVKRRALRR